MVYCTKGFFTIYKHSAWVWFKSSTCQPDANVWSRENCKKIALHPFDLKLGSVTVYEISQSLGQFHRAGLDIYFLPNIGNYFQFWVWWLRVGRDRKLLRFHKRDDTFNGKTSEEQAGPSVRRWERNCEVRKDLKFWEFRHAVLHSRASVIQLQENFSPLITLDFSPFM